jgi:hypothetical protein
MYCAYQSASLPSRSAAACSSKGFAPDAERPYTDMRRWTVMKRGGHFAAMELPEALGTDVQAFFRPLR